MVPAHCTRSAAIQAETLMPPPVEVPLVVDVPEEPPVEDAPSKFRTICSLVLEGRLKVTCCALEP
jgi:hypothetical protein